MDISTDQKELAEKLINLAKCAQFFTDMAAQCGS